MSNQTKSNEENNNKKFLFIGIGAALLIIAVILFLILSGGKTKAPAPTYPAVEIPKDENGELIKNISSPKVDEVKVSVDLSFEADTIEKEAILRYTELDCSSDCVTDITIDDIYIHLLENTFSYIVSGLDTVEYKFELIITGFVDEDRSETKDYVLEIGQITPINLEFKLELTSDGSINETTLSANALRFNIDMSPALIDAYEKGTLVLTEYKDSQQLNTSSSLHTASKPLTTLDFNNEDDYLEITGLLSNTYYKIELINVHINGEVYENWELKSTQTIVRTKKKTPKLLEVNTNVTNGLEIINIDSTHGYRQESVVGIDFKFSADENTEIVSVKYELDGVEFEENYEDFQITLSRLDLVNAKNISKFKVVGFSYNDNYGTPYVSTSVSNVFTDVYVLKDIPSIIGVDYLNELEQEQQDIISSIVNEMNNYKLLLENPDGAYLKRVKLNGQWFSVANDTALEEIIFRQLSASNVGEFDLNIDELCFDNGASSKEECAIIDEKVILVNHGTNPELNNFVINITPNLTEMTVVLGYEDVDNLIKEDDVLTAVLKKNGEVLEGRLTLDYFDAVNNEIKYVIDILPEESEDIFEVEVFLDLDKYNGASGDIYAPIKDFSLGKTPELGIGYIVDVQIDEEQITDTTIPLDIKIQDTRRFGVSKVEVKYRAFDPTDTNLWFVKDLELFGNYDPLTLEGDIVIDVLKENTNYEFVIQITDSSGLNIYVDEKIYNNEFTKMTAMSEPQLNDIIDITDKFLPQESIDYNLDVVSGDIFGDIRKVYTNEGELAVFNNVITSLTPNQIGVNTLTINAFEYFNGYKIVKVLVTRDVSVEISVEKPEPKLLNIEFTNSSKDLVNNVDYFMNDVTEVLTLTFEDKYPTTTITEIIIDLCGTELIASGTDITLGNNGDILTADVSIDFPKEAKSCKVDVISYSYDNGLVAENAVYKVTEIGQNEGSTLIYLRANEPFIGRVEQVLNEISEDEKIVLVKFEVEDHFNITDYESYLLKIYREDLETGTSEELAMDLKLQEASPNVFQVEVTVEDGYYYRLEIFSDLYYYGKGGTERDENGEFPGIIAHDEMIGEVYNIIAKAVIFEMNPVNISTDGRILDIERNITANEDKNGFGVTANSIQVRFGILGNRTDTDGNPLFTELKLVVCEYDENDPLSDKCENTVTPVYSHTFTEDEINKAYDDLPTGFIHTITGLDENKEYSMRLVHTGILEVEDTAGSSYDYVQTRVGIEAIENDLNLIINENDLDNSNKGFDKGTDIAIKVESTLDFSRIITNYTGEIGVVYTKTGDIYEFVYNAIDFTGEQLIKVRGVYVFDNYEYTFIDLSHLTLENNVHVAGSIPEIIDIELPDVINAGSTIEVKLVVDNNNDNYDIVQVVLSDGTTITLDQLTIRGDYANILFDYAVDVVSKDTTLTIESFIVRAKYVDGTDWNREVVVENLSTTFEVLGEDIVLDNFFNAMAPDTADTDKVSFEFSLDIKDNSINILDNTLKYVLFDSNADVVQEELIQYSHGDASIVMNVDGLIQNEYYRLEVYGNVDRYNNGNNVSEDMLLFRQDSIISGIVVSILTLPENMASPAKDNASVDLEIQVIEEKDDATPSSIEKVFVLFTEGSNLDYVCDIADTNLVAVDKDLSLSVAGVSFLKDALKTDSIYTVNICVFDAQDRPLLAKYSSKEFLTKKTLPVMDSITKTKTSFEKDEDIIFDIVFTNEDNAEIKKLILDVDGVEYEALVENNTKATLVNDNVWGSKHITVKDFVYSSNVTDETSPVVALLEEDIFVHKADINPLSIIIESLEDYVDVNTIPSVLLDLENIDNAVLKSITLEVFHSVTGKKDITITGANLIEIASNEYQLITEGIGALAGKVEYTIKEITFANGDGSTNAHDKTIDFEALDVSDSKFIKGDVPVFDARDDIEAVYTSDILETTITVDLVDLSNVLTSNNVNYSFIKESDNTVVYSASIELVNGQFKQTFTNLELEESYRLELDVEYSVYGHMGGDILDESVIYEEIISGLFFYLKEDKVQATRDSIELDLKLNDYIDEVKSVGIHVLELKEMDPSIIDGTEVCITAPTKDDPFLMWCALDEVIQISAADFVTLGDTGLVFDYASNNRISLIPRTEYQFSVKLYSDDAYTTEVDPLLINSGLDFSIRTVVDPVTINSVANPSSAFLEKGASDDFTIAYNNTDGAEIIGLDVVIDGVNVVLKPDGSDNNGYGELIIDNVLGEMKFAVVAGSEAYKTYTYVVNSIIWNDSYEVVETDFTGISSAEGDGTNHEFTITTLADTIRWSFTTSNHTDDSMELVVNVESDNDASISLIRYWVDGTPINGNVCDVDSIVRESDNSFTCTVVIDNLNSFYNRAIDLSVATSFNRGNVGTVDSTIQSVVVGNTIKTDITTNSDWITVSTAEIKLANFEIPRNNLAFARLFDTSNNQVGTDILFEGASDATYVMSFLMENLESNKEYSNLSFALYDIDGNELDTNITEKVSFTTRKRAPLYQELKVSSIEHGSEIEQGDRVEIEFVYENVDNAVIKSIDINGSKLLENSDLEVGFSVSTNGTLTTVKFIRIAPNAPGKIEINYGGVEYADHSDTSISYDKLITHNIDVQDSYFTVLGKHSVGIIDNIETSPGDTSTELKFTVDVIDDDNVIKKAEVYVFVGFYSPIDKDGNVCDLTADEAVLETNCVKWEDLDNIDVELDAIKTLIYARETIASGRRNTVTFDIDGLTIKDPFTIVVLVSEDRG